MPFVPPPQGEPLDLLGGEVHDYTITITVRGTDLGDCADLVALFADKIREGIPSEEGSMDMASGEYTIEGLDEDEDEDEDEKGEGEEGDGGVEDGLAGGGN